MSVLLCRQEHARTSPVLAN